MICSNAMPLDIKFVGLAVLGNNINAKILHDNYGYTILVLVQPLVPPLLMIVIYYSVFLCAMHIELLKVMNDLTFVQRLKSCVEAAEELLTKYMPMVESLR